MSRQYREMQACRPHRLAGLGFGFQGFGLLDVDACGTMRTWLQNPASQFKVVVLKLKLHLGSQTRNTEAAAWLYKDIPTLSHQVVYLLLHHVM